MANLVTRYAGAQARRPSTAHTPDKYKRWLHSELRSKLEYLAVNEHAVEFFIGWRLRLVLQKYLWAKYLDEIFQQTVPAALQLYLSEEYSSEFIKATTEPLSEDLGTILFDAWMALASGKDQTARITELLRKLFQLAPTVKVDVPQEPRYDELRSKINSETADYGLRAFMECLRTRPNPTTESYSCYVTILAKKTART